MYNLYNANTLTTIPLFGRDPAGPAIHFVLYHNTADAAANRTCAPGTGWHLGYGWSTSYSGRVEGAPEDDVTVIADDGTRDVYVYDSGRYVSAAWVHDRLEFVADFEDSGKDCWVLTTPGQTRRIYEYDDAAEVGRLVEVRDSIGLAVKVVRDGNGTITAVRSAAYGLPDVGVHQLTLFTPSDPNDADYGFLTGLTDVISREWTFGYSGDTNRRISQIEFYSNQASPPTMSFSYVNAGRYISVLTGRDNLSWEYSYGTGGRLASVIDRPDDYTGDPNDVTYSQYTFNVFVYNDPNYVGRRTIRDRRGEDWNYFYDGDGNLRKTVDPLSHDARYIYDAARNVTEYRNELGKVWTATYGAIGNVLTSSTPIAGQTWEYDWEPVGDPNSTNFWRLTEARDPNGHWVRYEYTDPNDPNDPPDATLLRRIIEMPATNDPNDTEAVTRLRYHVDPNQPSSYGQLYRVIDANGVTTQFDYNKWGYLNLYQESVLATGQLGGGGSLPAWVVPYGCGTDAAGRPGSGATPSGKADIYHDNDDNEEEVKCDELDPNNPIITSTGPVSISYNPYPRGPVASPVWFYQRQCLETATYDSAGRLTMAQRCIPWAVGGLSLFESRRKYNIDYDEFRRPVSIWTTSLPLHPSDTPTVREKAVLEYDAEGNPLEIVDASGRLITLSYDARGNVESVLHDSVLALYEYDAAGRLEKVENSDGTVTHTVYDDAGRVTQILHENEDQVVVLQIDYTWNLDNTVRRRAEVDALRNSLATTAFEYDHRKRLTRETRDQDGQVVYDVTYTYDPLGNRKSRTDAVAQRKTLYHYDTDLGDPFSLDHPSRHNRLLYYELFDTSGQSDVLLRTVRYTYYATGNASNITVKDEWVQGVTPGVEADYDAYHDLALYYFSNGQLWRAMRGTFTLDGEGQPDRESYVSGGVREFRFDDPRARYLTADFTGGDDPNNPPALQYPFEMTDYLGAAPLGDGQVELTGPDQTGLRVWDMTVHTQYMLDLYGEQDADTGEPTYYHGDLIGSTTATSDDTGALAQVVAYTAFGEYVSLTGTVDPNDPNQVIWTASIGGDLPAGFPRYGYAGQFGYESGLLSLNGPNTDLPPVTLQHLGWRWYDPSLGRFVQKDPIGIGGGLNVYEYAGSNPAKAIDPTGNRWYAPTGKTEWRLVSETVHSHKGKKYTEQKWCKFQEIAVWDRPKAKAATGTIMTASGGLLALPEGTVTKVVGGVCVVVGTILILSDLFAPDEIIDTFWQPTGECDTKYKPTPPADFWVPPPRWWEWTP